MSHSPRFVPAWIGLLACGSDIAAGAEWSMQPTVQLYFDHDSNRLLTPTNEEADFGEWLTLDASLKRATETGEIVVRPEFEVQRFSGDSPLNANSGSVQLAASDKWEQLSYTVNAGYSDQSTLISELANTGVVDASTRQEQTTGGLQLGDQFTEVQNVTLQASYANVKYPNGEPVGLIGYRDLGSSGTYAYSLSPETTLSAIAFGHQESAPASGFGSHDLGGRIGWAQFISETTSAYASIGLSHTYIASRQVNGSVWSLQATHDYELTRWTLSFTRDVVPNGFGFLTRRDELDLSAVRKLTARLDATLSVLAANNSDLVTNLVRDDRRYINAAAGIGWHASSQWLLSLKLQGSEARYPDLTGPQRVANGWQSIFTAVWTPLPWSISR
jgi:hypothetical protein